MTSAQATVWLRSRNLSADLKGSIHDEDRARALGFKAALIGGSVHSAFVTKAVVERVGRAWYERGFMKQSYIHPLYEGDEFRIVMDSLEPAETDEVLFELAFETRDGVRTTAGFAGLAKAALAAVPPWRREAATQPPDIGIPGEPASTFSRVVTIAESASRRELTGDDSAWYTAASPWGGPIVPSFMYMLLGSGQRSEHRQARDGAQQAGMNGTWQLLQTAPMFAGEPYTVVSSIVEKGSSGRTEFRTAEFTVTDSAGVQAAVARQKVRWIAG